MIAAQLTLDMVVVAGFRPARDVSLKQGVPLASKASVSTSSTTPRLYGVCARQWAGATIPRPRSNPRASHTRKLDRFMARGHSR
jgi:hypothetical protein